MVCLQTVASSGFLAESTNETFKLNNNIYYTVTGTAVRIAATAYTLAGIQAIGYDLNSYFLTDGQYADLFTNLAGGDYSLTSKSKAVASKLVTMLFVRIKFELPHRIVFCAVVPVILPLSTVVVLPTPPAFIKIPHTAESCLLKNVVYV